MTDSIIRAGDVCIDLIERGKVQVVGVAAATVAEHRETNSYDIADCKGNALLNVQPDERVFSCVYAPDKPSTSLSGTYDLPRSRLARVPVEEANEDCQRVQDGWTEQLLTTMFGVAADEDDSTRESVRWIARGSGIPDDVIDRARELADVERRVLSEEVGDQ